MDRGVANHSIFKGTLTMTLHDTEELDDDLRRRTDEDLTLAATLSVDNVVLYTGFSQSVSWAMTMGNSRGNRSDIVTIPKQSINRRA